VIARLPPQTAHLARSSAPVPFRAVLRRPVVLLALAATSVAVMASFAMVPNLSAYFQLNRGYPREQLGLLYLGGGVLSFATLRLAGWASDRYGAPIVAVFGSLFFATVLVVGFVAPFGAAPVLAIFVGFMVGSSARFVPLQSLATRVPAAAERARFMSAQSAVQHLASAVGAMIGAAVLVEGPGGALIGMEHLAWFAVASCVALPVFLYLVDRRLSPRRALSFSSPGTRVAVRGA
jgi:predicted MFS family arabinose efflux permease